MEQIESTNGFAYPDYINESRRPQKAPDTIVTDGKSAFGAFDGPIKNIAYRL